MHKTWNIIFLGIGLSTDITDQETQVIENGITLFKNDVESSNFNDNLKITLLRFVSTTAVGVAQIFTVEKNGDNNLFVQKEITGDFADSINNFNCQDAPSYASFFSAVVAESLLDRATRNNQKYMIVFLAHSFGAGFVPKGAVNPKTGEPALFSTIELNEAIAKGFKDGTNQIKVDCFLALNCILQSIETNIIFSENVSLLIGSQQELFPETISYRQLFESMCYSDDLNNETIFTKFIYDCYFKFKTKLLVNIKKPENAQVKSIFDLDNFCLCLSKPPLAKDIRDSLNVFTQITEINDDTKASTNTDLQNFINAGLCCQDPSNLELVNVIDACQFFSLLQNFYTPSSDSFNAIEKILESIKKTVILSVNSGLLCNHEPLPEAPIRQLFIPMGLGILIPRANSANLKAMVAIYQEIFNPDSDNLLTSSTRSAPAPATPKPTPVTVLKPAAPATPNPTVLPPQKNKPNFGLIIIKGTELTSVKHFSNPA